MGSFNGLTSTDCIGFRLVALVSHLTSASLMNEDVDMVEYFELKKNIFSNIDSEIISDIKRSIKKLELYGDYEKINKVKLFLKDLDD